MGWENLSQTVQKSDIVVAKLAISSAKREIGTAKRGNWKWLTVVTASSYKIHLWQTKWRTKKRSINDFKTTRSTKAQKRYQKVWQTRNKQNSNIKRQKASRTSGISRLLLFFRFNASTILSEEKLFQCSSCKESMNICAWINLFKGAFNIIFIKGSSVTKTAKAWQKLLRVCYQQVKNK